ncbi:hypothetical protein [Aquimarina longa]|uniref:hypothetical protein n=1 Tax=Aquimarina longa TaxID=1080221 RepID=UPI0007813D8A|nr:hypothetical protein [Aquimarina longa]
MNHKKEKIYDKIFKQGLIYESDANDLNQSLMDLFELEIRKKENQLNELNLKKQLLKESISATL